MGSHGEAKMVQMKSKSGPKVDPLQNVTMIAKGSKIINYLVPIKYACFYDFQCAQTSSKIDPPKYRKIVPKRHTPGHPKNIIRCICCGTLILRGLGAKVAPK